MNANGREPVLLPPLGEVLDFLRLIWAVDHQLQRTSKSMEARLGVTAAQRFVLRLVGRFPGITAGQLAVTLHVNPSTISAVLERLTRRGLIAKRRDPRDRRRTFLGLTDAGSVLNVDPGGTVESGVQRVIDELPALKVAAAREVLSTLAAALQGSLAQPAQVRRGRAVAGAPAPAPSEPVAARKAQA